MYPIYHLVLTITASGFLFPLLGWKLALFWLGSFFIDIDHYWWWYIIKSRDFNFKNAYEYGKDKRNTEFKLHILHTAEFWILLGIWSIFSELAFIILAGLIFHVIIDFTDMIARRIWYARSFSFLEWILTDKKA